MIDTVTIKTPFGELLQGMNWEQEIQWVSSWDKKTTSGYTQWFRNPTSEEKHSDLYCPQLTAYKERTHNWRLFVKIQFSVPKLYLGNNLDELTDRQLLPVLRALRNSLERIGFNPTLQALFQAEVLNLHYSKNILLADGYSVTEIISCLKRIQINGRLSKIDNQYTGGAGINLYNKSFCFSIYDKVAEIDTSLAESLGTYSDRPQVLRLEARLEDRKKLNHIFVKLELGRNPTFKEVFSSSKSCLVLTYFWETLISPQIAVVTDTHDSVNTLIQHLLRGIPELNINKAFKTAALIMAGRSFGGLNELKTIVLSHRSSRTWYGLNKQIKEANFVLANLETNWWEQIEDQLEAYEPLLLTQNL